MNVLETQHKKRCAGKQFYRRADSADWAAQRASKRTGELIISYKCYDCGGWHIGHADAAQIAAREALSKPICAICDKPIPEGRLGKAAHYKTRTTTCSPPCARRLTAQRRATADKDRDAGPKGSRREPS
jgi:hypothetical protein